jgi:4-amino-4-deoxy-L-arabinose transferase-like glycosyltransferase
VWGGWLLTYGVVFSMLHGIFHSYYLVMLAPAQAALVGIGLTVMWERYKRGGWQAWILPVTLGLNAAFQAYVLSGYSDWNIWLGPVLILVGIVSVAGLGLGLSARRHRLAISWSRRVVWATMIGLLIVPTAWSIKAVFTKIGGSLPSGKPDGTQAGPGPSFGQSSSTTNSDWLNFVKDNLLGQIYLIVAVLVLVLLAFVVTRLVRRQHLLTIRRIAAAALIVFLLSGSGWWFGAAQAKTSTSNTTANAVQAGFPGGMGAGSPGGDISQVDTKLVQYLEANQQDYTYLLAVSSANTAGPIILETGKAVMATGGFSGSDKILTTDKLAQLVKNHTVRYFLTGGMGGPGGGSDNITQWVQQQCKVVDSSLWSSQTTSNTTGSNTNGQPTGQPGASTGSNNAFPTGGFPGGPPPSANGSSGTGNANPFAGGFPGGMQQQQQLYDCSQA